MSDSAPIPLPEAASDPAKAKETCGYCGARRGLHTNDCVRPEAASETLTREEFERVLDCSTGHLVYDETTSAQMRQILTWNNVLLAHDAALRAALGKAEDNATRYENRFHIVVSQRDDERLAAEAKLKKAEEEVESKPAPAPPERCANRIGENGEPCGAPFGACDCALPVFTPPSSGEESMQEHPPSCDASDPAGVRLGEHEGKCSCKPAPSPAERCATCGHAHMYTDDMVHAFVPAPKPEAEEEQCARCKQPLRGDRHRGAVSHEFVHAPPITPVPASAERMDDAEFERLRVWNVRYGEWSDPGEISLVLDALLAEARRARESEAGKFWDTLNGKVIGEQVAEIAALRAATKKAEEERDGFRSGLDSAFTRIDALRCELVSVRSECAEEVEANANARDAAEAKLRKAEEERLKVYRERVAVTGHYGDRVRVHECGINGMKCDLCVVRGERDAAEARVETLERELETLRAK